jgi:hypothetical protein
MSLSAFSIAAWYRLPSALMPSLLKTISRVVKPVSRRLLTKAAAFSEGEASLAKPPLLSTSPK